MRALNIETVDIHWNTYGVSYYQDGNEIKIHEVLDLDDGQILPESNHKPVLKALEEKLSFKKENKS